eukprot:222264-Chlamydomonas_euryale.AAC.1
MPKRVYKKGNKLLARAGEMALFMSILVCAYSVPSVCHSVPSGRYHTSPPPPPVPQNQRLIWTLESKLTRGAALPAQLWVRKEHCEHGLGMLGFGSPHPKKQRGHKGKEQRGQKRRRRRAQARMRSKMHRWHSPATLEGQHRYISVGHL